MTNIRLSFVCSTFQKACVKRSNIGNTPFVMSQQQGIHFSRKVKSSVFMGGCKQRTTYTVFWRSMEFFGIINRDCCAVVLDETLGSQVSTRPLRLLRCKWSISAHMTQPTSHFCSLQNKQVSFISN